MRICFQIALLLLFSTSVVGQHRNDQAFWDRYDEARLYIAKHNAGRSIRILEELHSTDSVNPNVGYLLGVAKIIVGQEPQRAARLFEMADKHFDQLWDNPGVGPPEHLFYYMILAYCRSGQCSKAKEALGRLENTFATEEDYLKNDEYYLFDGRKWANRCAEPAAKEMEIPERLVKPDVRIRTQPHVYSTLSMLYGVQVAALLEPQMTRKFEGLKNVEVYVDMHGVYRYVIGNFNFRSQAEKMLQVVKEVGYADAFIVNITDHERYPLEVVALDQRSPKTQMRGTVDYRIQLAAFKESLPDESARYYLMIDSIAEVSVDDLTLLTVGSYLSYADAIMRRDELRRMGFSDAFVVAFNQGRKVSIEDARQYLRRVH